MTTVSTFLCAVVVDMHFRADKRSPPPRWLKTLMIDVAARAMCIRVPKPKKPLIPGQQTAATRSASVAISRRKSMDPSAMAEGQSLTGSLRSGAVTQLQSSSMQRPLKNQQLQQQNSSRAPSRGANAQGNKFEVCFSFTTLFTTIE